MILNVLEIGHATDESERDFHYGRPGDDEAWDTDDEEPRPKHPFLARFSATCQRWRCIAITRAPHLWTAMIGRYTLSMTDLALERSRSTQFDLYFGSGIGCPPPKDVLFFLQRTILNPLACDRIRSIRVVNGPQNPVNSSALLCNALMSLKVIDIACRKPGTVFFTGSSLSCLYPHLTSLSVACAPINPDIFERLHELKSIFLHRCTFTNTACITRIFSAAPCIETFSLHITAFDGNIPIISPDIEHVHAQYLKALSLSAPIEIIFSVLQGLGLPLCCSITMNGTVDHLNEDMKSIQRKLQSTLGEHLRKTGASFHDCHIMEPSGLPEEFGLRILGTNAVGYPNNFSFSFELDIEPLALVTLPDCVLGVFTDFISSVPGLYKDTNYLYVSHPSFYPPSFSATVPIENRWQSIYREMTELRTAVISVDELNISAFLKDTPQCLIELNFHGMLLCQEEYEAVKNRLSCVATSSSTRKLTLDNVTLEGTEVEHVTDFFSGQV